MGIAGNQVTIHGLPDKQHLGWVSLESRAELALRLGSCGAPQLPTSTTKTRTGRLFFRVTVNTRSVRQCCAGATLPVACYIGRIALLPKPREAARAPPIGQKASSSSAPSRQVALRNGSASERTSSVPGQDQRGRAEGSLFRRHDRRMPLWVAAPLPPSLVEKVSSIISQANVIVIPKCIAGGALTYRRW